MADHRKMQARWLALMAGTALALYGCWLLLKPFFAILTWAIVLVVMFYPLQRRLLAWTGRPGLSALASTVVVVLSIVVPFAFVISMLISDLPGLAENAREVAVELLSPQSPLAGPTLDLLAENVDLEELRSPEMFMNLAQRLGGLLVGPLLGVVGGIFGAAVQALFMVFAIFYLFRDGPAFADWLRHILPLEEVQSAEIFRRVREMIEASVYGVMVLALLQGALGGLAFLVLGLPNPLVWGAVMAVLSTIPVAGAFVVWIPAAIYLAATGDWGKAILLTAWGTLVIGTIDNFLRPKVMGQKARMHELLLFFAVLGGLVVFGVVGLVLGPVLVAVTLGLLDVIRLTDRPSDAIRREPGIAEQTARIADGDGASPPSRASV